MTEGSQEQTSLEAHFMGYSSFPPVSLAGIPKNLSSSERDLRLDRRSRSLRGEELVREPTSLAHFVRSTSSFLHTCVRNHKGANFVGSIT